MTPFKKWLETHNVLGDHSLVWIELALPCWLQFKIENIYLPIFKNKKKQQQQHARILANFLNNLLCPNFSCCPKNLSSPNFFGGGCRPPAPPSRAVRLWLSTKEDKSKEFQLLSGLSIDLKLHWVGCVFFQELWCFLSWWVLAKIFHMICIKFWCGLRTEISFLPNLFIVYCLSVI